MMNARITYKTTNRWIVYRIDDYFGLSETLGFVIADDEAQALRLARESYPGCDTVERIIERNQTDGKSSSV